MRRSFPKVRELLGSWQAPLVAALLTLVVIGGGFNLAHAADEQYDVVIYGGTSGGVAAAVQSARLGRTAIVIEPSQHIGGLSSGGLGATDIGNKGAIGGISREFYRSVKEYYAQPDAWRQEQAETYQNRRQRPDEDAMWFFEPHVAEKIFRRMLDQAQVQYLLGERLKVRELPDDEQGRPVVDRKPGVELRGGVIVRIHLESGRSIAGRIFIDATYEGDLLAAAGVSYHVGREANSVYNETLNGVQTLNARHHQFVKPVDPYIRPGAPDSGLLPGVDPTGPGVEGEGDRRVQAYNLRLCATDVPENRRPWPKPRDYDPQRFELLLRNFEAGDHRIPWNPILMPNRKTDANNNFAVSTDYIGANYDYPEAGPRRRAAIAADHLSYIQGLMWTLANSPRVPESIRQHFQTWGLAKDEFLDNDNFPHQLYVREARRMISDYVMTQHNCQGRVRAEDSVGLAAYTMDSHNVQRYVHEGYVRNEGDVQVGGFPPYPISYRSIVPKKSQCTNLLVPVCLSATHISYGSIRMEPVFMVLGQSAATAASQAIDQQAAVQDIDYRRLRERLLDDGQILDWSARSASGAGSIAADKLAGVVVDDSQAKLRGDWLPSASVGGYVGQGYRHDNNEGQGAKSAAYAPKLPEAGRYEVRLIYTPNGNRATNVPVTIRPADGEQRTSVNQRQAGRRDQELHYASLGVFQFAAGEQEAVVIETAGADGHVVIDAVQFVPQK